VGLHGGLCERRCNEILSSAQLGRKKVAILNAQYQRLTAAQAFVQAAEAVEGPPSPPRVAEAA
jgi:hypothetical protein